MPKNIINANRAYLVDKRLINGQKHYSTNGGVIVTTSDITARGMDIVEKIMNTSIEKLDKTTSSEINEGETTVQKLDKFYEKCVKIQPMCEIAVKVANTIFSNL